MVCRSPAGKTHRPAQRYCREDRNDKTPDNDRAEAIYYACLEAGLSFKISQGCVLTLSPPLAIERSDLLIALQIVVAAIKSTSN